MGIRFYCPACSGKLHVKHFLAGKRGVCPKCQASIWIPEQDELTQEPVAAVEERAPRVPRPSPPTPPAAALRENQPQPRDVSQGKPATREGRSDDDPAPVRAPARPDRPREPRRAADEAAAAKGTRLASNGTPAAANGTRAPASPSNGTKSAKPARPQPAAKDRTANERTANEQTVKPAAPAESLEHPSDAGLSLAASPQTEPRRPQPTESPAATDILGEVPHALWHVRPASGNQQYGPADAPTMRQWIAEGRVPGDALLWRSDWTQWRKASEVLGNLRPAATSPEMPVPIIAGPAATAASVAGKIGRVADARRRKRTQWALAVTLLACVAVGLLVTLVIVLRR